VKKCYQSVTVSAMSELNYNWKEIKVIWIAWVADRLSKCAN